MEKKDERDREREKELELFLRNAKESKRSYDYLDSPRKGAGKSITYISTALIIVLVFIALALIFGIKELKGGDRQKTVEREMPWGGGSGQSGDTLKLDQGKYQAVFLTNGQVYFGKVGMHDENYVELTDIYYLQVKPVLQQGDKSNANSGQDQTADQEQQSNSQKNQQTELSLVKLGNELHGPLDRMMISKAQVLFLEDLKDDSKVSQAIKTYQGQQQQKK